MTGVQTCALPILSVAVAANFTDAAKEIGAAWARASGHRPMFSFGATGQLYAQIAQGAPFEVFLAADQETVRRAIAEKHAVADTQFTYARGRIELYSRDPGLVKGPQTLVEGAFARLAIANPAAAPYGAAAVEAMKKLGVYDRLARRLVQGQSIAQAHQFVETGNAELGFVALAQIVDSNEGSRWVVDEALYAPIRQDAVLTARGAGSPAARAFLAYLAGPDAARTIEKYSYGTAR